MKYIFTLIILSYSFTSFSKVEDCHRRAQILHGLVEHHWIKTDTKIAGMGSGQITDKQIGDKFEAPYATLVFIIDHSNQVAETCKEILNIDEDCVNAELDFGKPLGHFSLINNCQSFVSNVFRRCSTIKTPREIFPGESF